MKSKLIYIIGSLVIVVTGAVITSIYFLQNGGDQESDPTPQRDAVVRERDSGDTDIERGELTVIGNIPSEIVSNLEYLTETYNDVVLKRVSIGDVGEYYVVGVEGDFYVRIEKATEHLAEVEERISKDPVTGEYLHILVAFSHRDLDQEVEEWERAYQLHTWTNSPYMPEWVAASAPLVAPIDHPRMGGLGE